MRKFRVKFNNGRKDGYVIADKFNFWNDCNNSQASFYRNVLVKEVVGSWFTYTIERKEEMLSVVLLNVSEIEEVY